jgi:hypothetical protein
MIRMLGLSWARHWHLPKVQMQGDNHVRIMLSDGAPMSMPDGAPSGRCVVT